MKKQIFSCFRTLLLLFALSVMVVGCGENKASQKAILKKATSELYAAVKEANDESTADSEKSADAFPVGAQDDKENLASDDVEEVGLPVYEKGQLSETIKKRYSYMVSYNHDMKNPNWVAWTITANHATGKVQRMDFWDDDDMPDPKGYLSDYYNSGYDRGHMCPAGDNKWSEKAMEDCFRITNMCPQDGGLNRGMWNSIEQQCRAWAKEYGKVYVVCGPLYLNQQHRKIGKNKVVVPEAFFKVVLCMEGTPKAIGFICRNQSQKGKKKTDFINTIDDVERITGYDFFSKLPDNIEKKVEAHADINDW